MDPIAPSLPVKKNNRLVKAWFIVLALVIGAIISFAFMAKANPGVSVDTSIIKVTEGDGAYTVKIQLTSVPTSPVTIDIASNNGVVGISPDSIVLSDATATSFQVDFPNDSVNLGGQYDTITYTVSSADADYDQISVPDTSVTILEDDLPGVTVGAKGQIVITEGESAQVSVVLDIAPTSDVEVVPIINGGSVMPEGVSDLSVSPASLTFTPENWNITQMLVLSVSEDSNDSGQRTGTLDFSVHSDDLSYNALSVAQFTDIQILDNDSDDGGGDNGDGNQHVDDEVFNFNPDGVQVVVGGTKSALQISLKEDPRAEYVFDVALVSGAHAVLDTTQLTFNTENWNIPQTINISAMSGEATRDAVQLSFDLCMDGAKGGEPNCIKIIFDDVAEISIIKEDTPVTPPSDSRPRGSSGGFISSIAKGQVQVGKADSSSSVQTDVKGSSFGSELGNSSKTLVRGIIDTEVAVLQKFLNTFLFSNLSVDGTFGERTQKALLVFQEGAGIASDGIVGPVTRSVISALGDTSSSQSLSLGSRGDRVRIIQRLLQDRGNLITVDGIFGPLTQSAIFKFQQDRGIKADGIAGPQTFLELQK